MGRNERSKTPPPILPKPKIKVVRPQNFLDSSSSSTTTTSDAQYRPTPKPRLRKPGPPKHILNQAGNADQSSFFSTDCAASDGSSESLSDPTACPPCCPCVCHYASKNSPETIQEHEDNYIITSENIINKNHRKVHSNVSLPARPLPMEPWQMAIMNVGGNADDNTEGIYAEADLLKHDDTTPKRSKSTPNSVTRKFQTPKKPVPTPRKCFKEEMATNEQSRPLVSLTNEKKNLTKQKKPSTSIKSPTTVSSISHSQSLNNRAGQFSSAMLPPSGFKFQRTRSCPYEKTKKNHGHSWEVLKEGLWQEHHLVKENGILNKLTKEEIYLQEIIYEVATSELSYFERITLVVNHFMNSPELKCTMTPQDEKELFSNMHKVKENSQNFLKSMVQELCCSLTCEVLCDVVRQYASGPFQVYVDYIRNMPHQRQTLISLRKENPHFMKTLQKLEKDPNCHRLSLDCFLSLPFQRISHLKLLMETVIKNAVSNSNIRTSAEAALTRISEVLEVCNKEVGMMKKIEDLVNLANKIEFECKALPLVSSSRWLIRIGEMTQLALNENIIRQKKNCPTYLILFNDLLLVASKKGTDRYVVHDYGLRSHIVVTEGAKVKDDLEGYDVSRVFLLVILVNHNKLSKEFLLQSSTVEERDSWLNEQRNEEGVYDQWDRSHVQCTEAYNQQQPGVLSLQKGDIVRIIQEKSDAGLMEGERLSDGKKGWFPANCVMVISEHMQRHNLLQRHHVLQAAAMLTKSRKNSQDQRSPTCFNKTLI